jgi:hypothetical protein
MSALGSLSGLLGNNGASGPDITSVNNNQKIALLPSNGNVGAILNFLNTGSNQNGGYPVSLSGNGTVSAPVIYNPATTSSGISWLWIVAIGIVAFFLIKKGG